MKSFSKYILWGIPLVVIALGVTTVLQKPKAPSSATAMIEMSPSIPVEKAYPFLIAPKSTLSSSFQELDISPSVVHEIVEAAKPIYNLARLTPGTRFQLTYDSVVATELTGVKFRFSAIDMLDLKKVNGEWKAAKITEAVEIKRVNFSGTVTSSLWESAENAKMDPNLISDLSEIFAWQVDFARAVRVNDRWRLLVEQKFVKGQPVGWGSILAAEYENAGELFQAALFRVNGESKGYYALDGSNLRRMFLKSPLKYGRITSGFSKKRFHPILGINRPHLGVDYGVAVGTPVRAVGDGVVIFAGTAGGAGKCVKIRHNSTYQTAYKHLSGYGKGVRVGSHVQQGQTIAFSGSTGLSTGPHLHFEFWQNGTYVDPLGKKFPSADPIPNQLLSQFKQEATPLLASLPAWQMAAADKARRETASASASTVEDKVLTK